MKSRTETLNDLALLQGDIRILVKELSLYTWDVGSPLVKISAENFSNILKRSINDEIDFETLSNWANAVECRDDLEFENEEMQEIVFELANPEINGEITKERLNAIVLLLEK
jgi:hypothetical protein